MPKILYCGNYNDGTGYGNAAISNILSLDAAGIEVVPRSITFNNNSFAESVPQRIRELEDNDLHNIDICMQHGLPTMFSYNGSFENIGVYYSETNHIDSMMWHKYLNLMDRILVCNKQMARTAHSSGVTKPIMISPLAIDVEQYKDPGTFKIKQINHSFNFCFVGELSKRKNIITLLKAFHTAFHPSENVNLVLKLNVPGLKSKSVLKRIHEVNKGVTDGLKIRRNYKAIVPVTGMLPHNDLLSLMAQCHVFTCASYGEAWCIPALEAMALGMPVIYTSNTGLDDFCHGWPVRSVEVPCNGSIDSLPSLYSSFDSWQEIDLEELMLVMKSAFQAWSYMPELFEHQKEKAINKALQYSYKNVGSILKDQLCQQ